MHRGRILSIHPFVSVKSEKALKAIVSTKLAAPVNLLETIVLCKSREGLSTKAAVFCEVATE